MKVAILSSFYPLRGGISQFNASMLAGLGKLHDVRAFSFKRQYPEILFPGKRSSGYCLLKEKALASCNFPSPASILALNWEMPPRRG